MDWILPPPPNEAACQALAQTLGVPPFLAALLCRRGLGGTEEAAAFLDPRLRLLQDPFLLPNMGAAIDRLLAALDRQEQIVLYGDYDVDGVTSLALFHRVLRAYGARVECFLPMRLEEGYGLSAEGLARCVAAFHPKLLIAIDCGTSSAHEIKRLCEQEIDVLVFDHHLPPSDLPQCAALVNPKLGTVGHSFCSAGIMFKAAHALLKRRPLPGLDLREFLDLVALGTVADIVPLEGENRILVKRGLYQLARSRWAGLQALVEVAGIAPPFTPGDIGFKLGPRMNAAGRLGTAQAALDLLLTDDPARAAELARALDAHNRERRGVEDQVFEEAVREVEAAELGAAVVVGARGWHPGVVGIVASRLVRRYHRPAIVIGFDEEGLGKGSGRSIGALPLVEALSAGAEFLEKFGGHEMAAGLAIREEKLGNFRAAFLGHARARLNEDHLRPRLTLDAEVQFAEVGLPLLRHHEQLQPFGMGNPQPVFWARRVELREEPRVMKEKHLSLRLAQAGREVRAVWFGSAGEKLPRLPWDVAFTLERNEYQGNVSVRLGVKAVRSSE